MRPLPVRGACCRWRKGEGDKAARETGSATRSDRWGGKASRRETMQRHGPDPQTWRHCAGACGDRGERTTDTDGQTGGG